MSKTPDEMPDNATDRPLVTFALFAYNQEEYIREAIEGAFAQTYEPLEIILSDDCSNDRTFNIMEEMARDYTGPHKVITRQGEINFGTAMHVHAVGRKSNGRLIVIASGDDISEPQRCNEIAEHWISAGMPICCLHSGAQFFDGCTDQDQGCVPPRTGTIADGAKSELWLHKGALPFLSPTCAYSRELFTEFEPMTGGSIIEDGVMTVRSLLCGRLISIDAPLVRIRRSAETAGTGYRLTKPARWNVFVRSRMIGYVDQSRDIARSKLGERARGTLAASNMKKARWLALFLIPETKRSGVLYRVVFVFKYVAFWPYSGGTLVGKFADAFIVAGFSNSAFYRIMRATIKTPRKIFCLSDGPSPK